MLTGEAPPPPHTVNSVSSSPGGSSSPLLSAECPSVRELHVELDEVSQLLDVSKEQYDEILSIVQRHTDETINWLSDMAAEFGWVGRAGSNSSGPENIFSITMVRRTDGDN